MEQFSAALRFFVYQKIENRKKFDEFFILLFLL